MATFVLVHGAWMGGWGYKPVARRLREAGHEVHTPTLTGLGERTHLASPAITLSTHIQDVVNVFDYENIERAVLVGHSYGGMVVTGVASKLADRLSSLVYLDAFLPEDGEALWDIAPSEARRHYIDGQRETPGLVAPLPGIATGRRLSLHPLLTLLEPVQVTDAVQALPRTYIYASREPAGFTRFYDKVKDDPAWRVHTIATSHLVMADDPDGLTTLLLQEADR